MNACLVALLGKLSNLDEIEIETDANAMAAKFCAYLSFLEDRSAYA